MSGVEALAIVAAVAAVVSAFRDGGSIFSSIKKKRHRESGSHIEDALEESLYSGPPAITAVAKRGKDMYGQKFLIGDDRATSELYKITSELNGTLLKQLNLAILNDAYNDFASCTLASDGGRTRSITVLTELQMRIEQMRLVRELLPTQPESLPSYSRVQTLSSIDEQEPASRPRRNSDRPPNPISYFPKFTWLKTKDKRINTSDNRRTQSFSDAPPSSCTSLSTSLTSPRSPVEMELEVNPWNDVHSSSGVEVIPALPSQPSFALSKKTSRALPPLPKSDNNYFGLCPSAAAFHVLDFEKCFSKHKEPARIFGDIPFVMCTKCAFTGKISRTSVYSFGGIKLRWAFLAKSHIPQKRAKNGSYSYRCLFCIFAGNSAPVIETNDALFSHLASHRDTELEDWILERTRCINDRVADDEEDFDINLCPLSAEIDQSHRPSILLPLPGSPEESEFVAESTNWARS